MEYFYEEPNYETDADGKPLSDKPVSHTKVAVPLERWAWGVIYVPTLEAKNEAMEATEEYRIKIRALRERAIEIAENDGESRDMIHKLKKEYDAQLALTIEPRREELKQFGNDGMFHKFAEIDQSRVEMFIMYKPDDLTKRIDMPAHGVQFFHFYRNLILRFGTPEERRLRVYVFGYRNGDTAAYHFILPDDRIIISNKDNVELERFNI